MTDHRDPVEDVFRSDILGRAIPEYSAREQQVDMALAVSRALDRGGLHLFEAGTGIGKSLAYMIPALLSGRRIFVSTATITLQDQLACKDAPAILSALDLDADIFVLKGRNNYLCLRKWESAPPSLGIDSELAHWAGTTEDGDVSSCPVEVDQQSWRHFRSDHIDCTGNSCRFRGRCFFFRARNLARKADLLILNHHLLVSGMNSEDVLPGADVLVIDEGHRLEDAASECLGLVLGESTLLPVFDGIAFSSLDTERKAVLLQQARKLSAAVADLTDGIKETSAWDPAAHLEELGEVEQAAVELRGLLGNDEELMGASAATGMIREAAGQFTRLSFQEYCCFVETGRRHPILRGVPLDIGPELREKVYINFDTTILTSATLTVAGEFDFYRNRLGAWDAVTAGFGSPFDYSSQAVLHIPDSLPPHDSHDELAQAAWSWALKLSGWLGGRTLMLFTSYRNLKLVHDLARENLPADMKLFVQGEQSRTRILQDFRECSRGIILGTSSFWEGVDLPGALLQAVIIDRLPFSSPGHPLTRARMEKIEREGGSSFGGYTLPLAAVRLKQGVGRLIRSADDIGVVMILDRRILSRNYGSVFLRTIPPFRTATESEMESFVMEHCGI